MVDQKGCDLGSLLVGSVNRAASRHISLLSLNWEFGAPGGVLLLLLLLSNYHPLRYNLSGSLLVSVLTPIDIPAA